MRVGLLASNLSLFVGSALLAICAELLELELLGDKLLVLAGIVISVLAGGAFETQ